MMRGCKDIVIRIKGSQEEKGLELLDFFYLNTFSRKQDKVVVSVSPFLTDL